jgi:holo-[acyl-carrier protein] synthase
VVREGEEDGVVASGVEIVDVAEAEEILADGGRGLFSEGELRYARERSDPGRRLAARLAAKRVACRLLGGGGLDESDVAVERGAYGPPSLLFSSRARERMEALGATRALVSLTHERKQAAALVLLLRDAR